MCTKKSKKNEKFMEISIPTQLFEKIKERIKGTGFTSVSSYVKYVLEELLSEEEEEKVSYTKEDEEKIKARLRALGYID